MIDPSSRVLAHTAGPIAAAPHCFGGGGGGGLYSAGKVRPLAATARLESMRRVSERGERGAPRRGSSCAVGWVDGTSCDLPPFHLKLSEYFFGLAFSSLLGLDWATSYFQPLRSVSHCWFPQECCHLL